jgi:hypothetical protein
MVWQTALNLSFSGTSVMHPYIGLGQEVPASLPGTGVLLVNLGTPDAPTAAALRPYLAEFLSDPRVIEYTRWLWWPVLQGILRIRPRRSAQAYARIWTPEGSPLRVLSEALTAAVGTELDRRGHDMKVVLAMNYGHPRVTTPSPRCSARASDGCWWCRFIRNIRQRAAAVSSMR